MPRLLTAAALLSGVLANSGSLAGPPSDQHIRDMFSEFQVRYNKTYADDAADRFLAFRLNILQAYDLNLKQGVDCQDMFDKAKCVFGVTEFSDISPEEFALTHFGYKPPAHEAQGVKVLDRKDLPNFLPEAIDWRTRGAVTPVKNQGGCGSCWAFSAVSEIESAVFLATGQLLELSTQQVISCDTLDSGCHGGWPDNAYQYAKQVGGLASVSDYPDVSSSTGQTGTCSWDGSRAAQCSGAAVAYALPACTSGPCDNQDENWLAAAVANGPVSVCLNAKPWQSYMGGIFSADCGHAAADIDHCVQLVGFDMSSASRYWIVRNSWGPGWGAGGYIYLGMYSNQCGVANHATVVTQVTTSASDRLVV